MMPPHQFHCLLDELPLHLVPQQFLNRQSCRHEPAQELFLNPECSFLPAGEVPEELQAHRDLLEGFNLQGTVAWVRDPATCCAASVLAGTTSRSRRFRDSACGEPAPSLPRRSAAIAGAGWHLDARRIIASDVLRSGLKSSRVRAQAFRERNYVPLGDLIHPFNLAALRRYYRYAIRRGAIRLGDEQSARRYVAHNEPVARYFHHQITNAVSAIVGEPVKPSYVYLASYLSGAELKKHTDRQQCEFSVTLCLDFSPEPELATSWPIRLDTPEGTVTVYQALGDGLVYRGTKVPHYRDVLGKGYTSTSIFFHYVPSDFSGSLD